MLKKVKINIKKKVKRMLVEEQITKKFCSYELTDYKYHTVHDFALFLLAFKNKLSEDFNNNVLNYLNDFTASFFVTYCRNRYPKEISSNFDHQIYEGIYNDYVNKFE